MTRSPLVSRSLFALFALVLVAGTVLAAADAGAPVAVGVALGALAVCLVAGVALGVAGFRDARGKGKGVVRSIGAGVKASVRSLLDLL